MTQEYIEIRGARENNLKNVSLKIPKRKITIFTGVSGSGKSSIVFDTVATEAQRQMNENFSIFIRTFLPRYSQPDADAIENLSTPIVVDQKRHNASVIKNADWIIDMGPEGGTKGGRVMFEGTLKQLLTAKNSLTSEYIRN